MVRVAFTAAQGIGAGSVLGYAHKSFSPTEVTEGFWFEPGRLSARLGRIFAKTRSDP